MNNQYFSTNYTYPSVQPYQDRYYREGSKFVMADEGFTKGNLQIGKYRPYKNYQVRMPIANSEKAKKLLEIQKIGFAAYEVSLYLDVYPEDKDAIKAYSYYRIEEERLTREYENAYGPLSLCAPENDTYPWSWVKGPWPWEVRK